jgi:hypothetical protein
LIHSRDTRLSNVIEQLEEKSLEMRQMPKEVQQLIDRQHIYDCIVRYCSGVDRFDREMVKSVYHADALDDHGAFVGTVDEFVTWAFAYHAKYPG